MRRNTFALRWLGIADASESAASRSRQENRRRLRPALVELEARRLLSTFMVTNKSDDPNNTHSLRYAMDHATSGSTIKFAPGVTGTITLTNGQFDITKNLVIKGPPHACWRRTAQIPSLLGGRNGD